MINENDGWSVDGANFLSGEQLAILERALERAPLILEHRFYRGAKSPQRLIFDDCGDLIAYLTANANAGDHFFAWNYSDLCRDDNRIASGKCPDKLGRVPGGGAY